MSKYLDEMGIKSVVGINKWIKEQLQNKNVTIINSSGIIAPLEIECVKVDNAVYIFWAINNKLMKYEMKCSVIYVLQKEDLEKALETIVKSLN